MGTYLMGMYVTGVYLMGMHLMCMHLTGGTVQKAGTDEHLIMGVSDI